MIPVTASPHGLRGLAGFRDWLAGFRTDRVITAPVWGVLLTQADLDAQGQMRTEVGTTSPSSERQSRIHERHYRQDQTPECSGPRW